MNKIKILIAFVLLSNVALAQTTSKKEEAFEIGNKAVELMDKGEFKESIKLLEKAKKLDPDNIVYPYEIAYAHYIQKDYSESIKILKELVNKEDAIPHVFQLLGNSYDYIGDTTSAFKAYDKGLEKFPKSGMMYLEKGNVYWNQKAYLKALPFYEKGIELDPTFASNYYRAARVYCASNEELWGMIYGEIFMNLERGTKRTAEISKLLFDTYKREIKFTSDTSFSVSFSSNMVIDISDLKSLALPYGTAVYEPTLLFSIVDIDTITINTLDTIRTKFLYNYFENKHHKKYPNVLFDYQKSVQEAGHLEAYNYWILMKGDDQESDKWIESNQEKWDEFINWFGKNKLQINEGNKFYSDMYKSQ